MATGAYTPIFEVSANGQNVTANFQNRATEIRVDLASGGGSQDTCTITCDDRDWLVAAPKVGDKISVGLGYIEVGMAYQGTFEIDEVLFLGPPKSISIHGNSEGFNSSFKSPEQKQHENKTVGEILNDIGSKLGLSVTVDPSIASEKIEFLNQTVSPMHLLGQLEHRYGGVAKISGGQLAFAKRDSGMSASGQEIPLVVLRKEHLASWEVKHLNRSDYTKVEAVYIDKDTNKEVVVDAQSAVDGILGQGSSGGDKPMRLKNIFPSEAEAKAAANSQMKSLDRNLGEGVFALAQGDPWIRDQNRILVIGTRDGVDGSYVADLVSHTYTKESGIRTAIRTQPSGDGASFAPLYEANPGGAYAPGPGQVTGDVMPQIGADGRAPSQRQYSPGGA